MRRPEPAFRRPVSGIKRMSNPISYRVLMGALCGLVGAVLAQSAQASTLEAINHTHWAINRFSVDGRSGIDIIGPYQGGGGGCCYIAPSLWQPGMTVRVDWETGAGSSKGFPGFADEAKYEAWAGKLRAQKRPASFKKIESILHNL